MKPTPIHEILRRVRPLALQHQAAHLRGHIASEQGGNNRKTSVRIRDLQAALADVQLRRLKRERAA
jgi:hypothetical protein